MADVSERNIGKINEQTLSCALSAFSWGQKGRLSHLCGVELVVLQKLPEFHLHKFQHVGTRAFLKGGNEGFPGLGPPSHLQRGREGVPDPPLRPRRPTEPPDIPGQGSIG